MPIVTYTWLDGTSGDWSAASNWSSGVVPEGTNNATISGSGTETVTVSGNQSVNALTLSDANATLLVTNYATLSIYGGLSISAVHEIDVTSGTLLVGGGSQTLDNVTINLGILTTDTLSQQSEVLTLGPNLIANGGNGAIEGGFATGDGIVNQGTVNVSGSLVVKGDAITNAGAIGGGRLDIEFGSDFTNDLGGNISSVNMYLAYGGDGAYGTGRFTNDGTISGTTLEIWSNDGSIFTNNGTLSGGQLTIYSNGPFTNYGTISVEVSGALPSAFSVTGSFDNEGIISVTNGDTLGLQIVGDSINNGAISVGSGSRLIFGQLLANGFQFATGDMTGSGSFVIDDGGTLELQSGDLANTVDFTSGGSGTLQLDGVNLFTGSISGLGDRRRHRLRASGRR
jgi:hypothetical protein